MPALRQTPSLLLICFGLICGPIRGQEASVSQFVPPPQPNVQERLLAELLSQMPETERAEAIARALAAVRGDEGAKADASGEPGSQPLRRAKLSEESLREALQPIPLQMAALLSETRALRIEVLRLQSLALREHSRAPREYAQTPLVPAPGAQGRAFLLPNFQRPGIQSLPGPYVNQPSGPLPGWERAPSSDSGRATELAQLQRDLQRLNQRLRQWQDPAAAAEPARETGEPALAPQATRPSPLLPR